MGTATATRNLGFKVALPVIIGVAVVAVMFYREFNIEALEQIRFTPRAWLCLPLALVAVFLRDFGLAWRFRSLTDRQLRWKSAANVTLLCEFTSAITPTSVGGSALSMFFLKKEGINMGRSTALTMTTLFLDELFFVIIVPVVILLVPEEKLFGFDVANSGGLEVAFWIAYALIFVWTAVLFLGLIAFPSFIQATIKRLFRLKFLRKWEVNANELADNIYSTSRSLRTRTKRWWAEAFIATTVSWCGRYLVVNALFFGFFPLAPQSVVFCRQVIVWALLMFSPTPGGSGLSEWLFKQYYCDLISGAGAVMILALIWRLLSYYIYLIIGIFLIPAFIKKK